LKKKKESPAPGMKSSGNGGPDRTRTGTASLPGDFESPASTNSATGPYVYFMSEQIPVQELRKNACRHEKDSEKPHKNRQKTYFQVEA
jgi:hypothetical protein